MENYYYVLKKCSLFEHIEKEDLLKLLSCLDCKLKEYSINTSVINIEDKIASIGIVLSGSLTISKEDFDGNRNIITNINPSEIFGESFIFAELSNSPVSITANTNSTVLFLNPNNLLSSCPKNCSFHTKLISNSIKILAKKNLELNYKIELLSHKSINERITFYLKSQQLKNKSSKFTIPFSRNDLADFLCVNRSALSRELSNMKKQNQIDYNKNNFVIINLL